MTLPTSRCWNRSGSKIAKLTETTIEVAAARMAASTAGCVRGAGCVRSAGAAAGPQRGPAGPLGGAPRASLLDLHREHVVTLHDLLDDVHTLHHPSEDGVAPVEVRLRRVVDEHLSAAR